MLSSTELKELWQLYTTGKKRCMLPVHQAVSRLGEPLARAVNKTHVLAGDDCMSKLGNEHTAVVCDYVQYLRNCGYLSSSNWYVSGQELDQLQLQKHLTS